MTTRIFVVALTSVSALVVSACAGPQPVRPESRLGANEAAETYRWNGNAKRRGYDARSLDGKGAGPQEAGGRSGATASGGDTVLFTSDSTQLTPEAMAILDGFVAQARGQRPLLALSIEGHADERGTRDYNIALGARRAAAVKSYLLTKGLLESQVRTTSFGKERPVATCDDISCWARNRRAQLVIAAP